LKNFINKNKKAIYFIFPFICLGIALVVKIYLKQITLLFPSCVFKDSFGFDCPACGNTRSVTALLRGDVVSAVKYNISPVIVAVLGVLCYIEGGFKLFEKSIKLIPRNKWFWGVFFTLLFVYYIGRNFV